MRFYQWRGDLRRAITKTITSPPSPADTSGSLSLKPVICGSAGLPKGPEKAQRLLSGGPAAPVLHCDSSRTDSSVSRATDGAAAARGRHPKQFQRCFLSEKGPCSVVSWLHLNFGEVFALLPRLRFVCYFCFLNKNKIRLDCL